MAAPPIKLSGWILDLYADRQKGIILWLLGEDGKRHQLHQPFPVTFYAAGWRTDLRRLWQVLRQEKAPVKLARTQKENSAGQELEVMKIAVQNPALQPRILHEAIKRFPDLEYYDTDIPLSLRYSVAHSVFPFAKCELEIDRTGRILAIQALDSRWDIDPEPAPFRVLKILPDTDPSHEPPKSLSVNAGHSEYQVPLSDDRLLLEILSQIIDGYDPDFIVTSFGDTWLFPYLFALSKKLSVDFNPNRDKSRHPMQMKEHSYVQYGRVMYRGQQTHLFGRFHIDRHNAMTYGEYGIPGAIKQARVTGVPIQEMARKSPGAGITAMFMLTSLKRGSIYPHFKQHVEQPKTLTQLDLADTGGLVYKPLIGFFPDAIQIDFSSMYPSIMSLWNVSPETVGVTSNIVRKVPELGLNIDQERRGLVSETLEPLLKLRLELKGMLETLDPNSHEYKLIHAESTALKWLLVVCFGYQGYKRFREGRIEAHESITAISRWILLRTKEIAEEAGYLILHMYVDGIWMRRKDGARTKPEEIKQLLRHVEDETGLPIAVEADYRWIAFLPSRRDPQDPVPNRYFGELRDGTFKMRGIGNRRHDTPLWVSKAELDAFAAIGKVEDTTATDQMKEAVVAVLQRYVDELRQGQVQIEDFVVRINITREISQYKVKTAAARAGAQLEAEGRKLRPGQRVRFIYTWGPEKVMAWDLLNPPTLKDVDIDRYVELLIRMGSTIAQPFGMSEKELQSLVLDKARAIHFSEIPHIVK